MLGLSEVSGSFIPNSHDSKSTCNIKRKLSIFNIYILWNIYILIPLLILTLRCGYMLKKKKKIWPLSSLPPSPTIFHLTVQFYKDRNIPSTCQVCLASVLFLFSLCCCPPGKLFILEIQVSFVNNQGCTYLRYLKYLTTCLKF